MRGKLQVSTTNLYLYYYDISIQVSIIYPGGEDRRQPLHRRFLPSQSALLSPSAPDNINLRLEDPIAGHSRLFIHQSTITGFARALWRSRELRLFVYYGWILKMWELCNILLGNLLSLYLYSPLKTALFPHFSYKVLGVLPRLVWSQRSCSASLFSQLWEYLRASRKWESISLGLSGSVGIKGHAVAEAVAEAPKGVARALLHIVSFLLHPSFGTFYHTFHHESLQAVIFSCCLGGHLSHQSKLQSTIALSSTEAEYMATKEAGKEALWVVRFLACLGFRLPSQPVNLRADNKGAISLTENPEFYRKTKDIEVRWHRIREKVERKDILILYISTKEMLADGLTKAPSPKMFKKFRKMIGMS